MKIIARTPTELIIRDSALTLRVFGLFLLGLAAFVLAIGVTEDPGGEVAVVPTVIAAAVAVGGLAMIVLPSRKTFAFSKADRVFIIARQRFGRVERQAIPLRDIADVTLEQSRSGDDGDTYRVSVTLADQRRIPWTSYYEVGSAYTAFYDPQDPSEAFLMRSRSIIPWAFLVIPLMGMAFIVAGIRGSYESERQSRWPR
jgi:hypothetical protein